jgi:hypothetical protein
MAFFEMSRQKDVVEKMSGGWTRPPKVGKKIFGNGHLGKQRESFLMVTVVP